VERIPSERPAVILRTLTGALILFSIMVTYYVMIIEKDYLIITNPDGPDTEEYFLELFGE
jgi:hypothetical protein